MWKQATTWSFNSRDSNVLSRIAKVNHVGLPLPSEPLNLILKFFFSLRREPEYSYHKDPEGKALCPSQPLMRLGGSTGKWEG